jgi:hypothetical protein
MEKELIFLIGNILIDLNLYVILKKGRTFAHGQVI